MATRVQGNNQLSLRIEPMIRYLPRPPTIQGKGLGTAGAREKSPIAEARKVLWTEGSGGKRGKSQGGGRLMAVVGALSPARHRRGNEGRGGSSLAGPVEKTGKAQEIAMKVNKKARKFRLRKRKSNISADSRIASAPLPAQPRETAAPGSAKWEETTRICWHRRSAFRLHPLLILNWEGVLGDYIKPPWSCTAPDLVLRPGTEKSLLEVLLPRFQIALLTSLSSGPRTTLLDHLEKRSGLVFDAVYKKRKRDGTSFVLDYSQVLLDFSRDPSLESVLIVSSLGLDQDDIAAREGKALIEDCSVSRHRRYLW